MSKNVLVTGGAGFIGTNFIRGWLESDPEVRIVNLDALTYAGRRDNLREWESSDRYVFYQGNIGDRQLADRILRLHRVDAVVNFAAETHVDRSLRDARPFFETNVLGTLGLLEAVCRYQDEVGSAGKMVRFHHVSTDEVFGPLDPGAAPFTEASVYAPHSPYAASKAAADHLVRSMYHSRGLPATISASSNNFGPYQFPEKLVALAIVRALHGETLPVYGDGAQIRDWLFVDDHCEAVRRILEQGEPGETYLVGGGVQAANLDVIRQICRLLDERFPSSPHTPHERLIRFVADRPGHDRRYAVDPTRIQSGLGWRPQTGFTAGLERTVDWYIGHPDWVSAVREEKNYREWIAEQYPGMGVAA